MIVKQVLINIFKLFVSLNDLLRLKRYLGPEERFVLVNSFVYSNFNYCPLEWMLSSKESLNYIENLQKGASLL